MYSRSNNNNKKTPIYFNTNYCTEMKLVLIIMDYCLLQFDALKFFLGVRLHGRPQPNFNFFNVNPQIFNEMVKNVLILSTSVMLKRKNFLVENFGGLH